MSECKTAETLSRENICDYMTSVSDICFKLFIKNKIHKHMKNIKNKVQKHSKSVMVKLFTNTVNLLPFIGDHLLQIVDYVYVQ